MGLLVGSPAARRSFLSRSERLRLLPRLWACGQGGNGSQFTSAAFTGALAKAGVAISMDGRGRWMDNVFIERLWRSLKYEDVYLKGYADGREAARGIAEWIAFYNEQRPHQALADCAPMALWREAIAGGETVDLMDNATSKRDCVCRWRPYGPSIAQGCRLMGLPDPPSTKCRPSLDDTEIVGRMQ